MEPRILVTGATGFIGRYLLEELARRNMNFWGMSDNCPENFLFKERLSVVSLLDTENLKKIIFEYQPTAVIHLAAIASVMHQNIPQIYEVNVVGTENLLEAVRDLKQSNIRVVLVSTAGVYGNQTQDFLHEEDPFAPSNHYSYSKVVVEYLSKNYPMFETKIVRPFNIIGTGQTTGFFIPKLIKSFVTKEEVLRLGNIDSVRDYIDVEFCTKVIIDVATSTDVTERIYNICSGIPYSGNQVIKLLERLTNWKPKIEINQDFVRDHEVWRLVGDVNRLNRLLNAKYKSKSLEEILIEMISQEKKSFYMED